MDADIAALLQSLPTPRERAIGWLDYVIERDPKQAEFMLILMHACYLKYELKNPENSAAVFDAAADLWRKSRIEIKCPVKRLGSARLSQRNAAIILLLAFRRVLKAIVKLPKVQTVHSKRFTT